MRIARDFRDFRRKSRQRGLSLIEAAMVLAIMTLVIAGVMTFFQNANNSQKANESVGQLAAIQQAVRSLFAGQSSYLDLTTAVVAESRLLPNKMVGAGSTLRNSFNGTIEILPSGGSTTPADSMFSVRYTNLPVEACRRMATMDLGTGLYAVVVAVAGAAATPSYSCTAGAQGCSQPLSPAQANTSCGTTNGSEIAWTFF
jgi:type II secretory pathway pseudopilin PulG